MKVIKTRIEKLAFRMLSPGEEADRLSHAEIKEVAEFILAEPAPAPESYEYTLGAVVEANWSMGRSDVIDCVAQYGHAVDGELERLNKLVGGQAAYCNQKREHVEILEKAARPQEGDFCRIERHPKVGQILIRKFEDDETEDPSISIEYVTPDFIRVKLELSSHTEEKRDKLYNEMTGETLYKRLESVMGGLG